MRLPIERRMAGSEEGSALVEAALCMSMMVMLLMGVADYTLDIQQTIQINEAAAAGAAFGAIPGNQTNLAGMEAAAKASAPGVSAMTAVAVDLYTCTPGGAAVSESSTCAGYGTPIQYVQVTASAPVNSLLTRVKFQNSMTVTAVATYRVPWK